LNLGINAILRAIPRIVHGDVSTYRSDFRKPVFNMRFKGLRAITYSSQYEFQTQSEGVSNVEEGPATGGVDAIPGYNDRCCCTGYAHAGLLSLCRSTCQVSDSRSRGPGPVTARPREQTPPDSFLRLSSH
jgi:hypothetical protein